MAPSIDGETARKAKLVAVTVGVNQYCAGSNLAPLQYAENDADLIGECLRAHDYYVIPLKGPDARSENVEDVFDRLQTCLDAETLVFFFAGHGSQSGTEFASLHFYNSRPETGSGTLDTNGLTKLARRLRIKKMLFIIDACRGSGQYARSRGSTAMPGGTAARDMAFGAEAQNERAFCRYFLMSCSDFQVSSEEPEWRNGVFTRILVNHLTESGGDFPVTGLYHRVASETAEWCALKKYPEQHPTWGTTHQVLFIGVDILGKQLEWATKVKAYDPIRSKLTVLLEDLANPQLPGVVDEAIRVCPDFNELVQLRELRTHLTKGERPSEGQFTRMTKIDEIVRQLDKDGAALAGSIYEEQITESAAGSRILTIETAFENTLSLADRYLLSVDEPRVMEMLERARILAGDDPDRLKRVELRRRAASDFMKRRPVVKNHCGVEFVHIPAGGFRMGPPGAMKHVQIAKPFWISRSPIRGVVWKNFDSRDHQVRRRPNFPVAHVPFETARGFCERVLGGRLPTEAEWEYAARGMSETRFPWGEEFSMDFANVGGSGIPVCGGPPNSFGLLDVMGNVWEWCEDLFAPPQRLRSVRGGCWRTKPQDLAVWTREPRNPATPDPEVGFRCVLNA